MRWARQACFVWLFALAVGTESLDGQAIPKTTADTQVALHSLSSQAGVIFAGQVLSVHLRQGANGATGVVAIEFSVEDAVRGVSGSTYTLYEWAGLWPAGEQPFQVGQRFLMLLHAPGPSGLSSPVGGTDGAIPIHGASQPVPLDAVNPQAPPVAQTRVAVIPAAPDGSIVDLRWIATAVSRDVVYRQPDRQTALPVSTRPNLITSQAEDAAAEGNSEPPASQAAPYTAVLATLHGWEKSDNAAR